MIGIQVFQHGTRAQAHQHLLAAGERVAGGLLCVRVNATDPDTEHDHDRIEDPAGGGFAVRYRSGPKAGLDVHFFTAAELRALVADRFTELLAPRLHTTRRPAPGQGQWSQWEAIWQRRRGDEVQRHLYVLGRHPKWSWPAVPVVAGGEPGACARSTVRRDPCHLEHIWTTASGLRNGVTV